MESKSKIKDILENTDNDNIIIEQHSINEEKNLEGKCVECEDADFVYSCVECQGDYCEICFAGLHRAGNRKNHQKITRKGYSNNNSKNDQNKMEIDSSHNDQNSNFYDDSDSDDDSNSGPSDSHDFYERAKYIPMRLSLKERKLLRLLEATLNVSEYTDKVDSLSINANKRIFNQVTEICAILSGIIVGLNYEEGQTLTSDKNFVIHADKFQTIFEIGRRHKTMNPEKMRSEYGKLMYLLQDSVTPTAQNTLEFNCIKPIHTVFRELKAGGSVKMLKDARVEIATRAITSYNDDGSKKSRQEVRDEVRRKERAVDELSRQYRTPKLSSDDIQGCLYSIGDNRSFLLTNRDTVDKMIFLLKRYFKADDYEEGYSLAINSGDQGARLSHSHERQYYYVLQSMTLWREVCNEMFKLWCLADEDLLNPSLAYQLKDTGQGVHRIQQAPSIGKTMREILFKVQQQFGEHWVGSSVVHLGDHNVPNALMFIDKYTQVSRILNPIVITLSRIDELIQDPKIKWYIDTIHGGKEKLKRDILLDFFKFGFDGSGADNFFDAGSCIDGRLTSAWNWCSKLNEKNYFPIFKLTSFIGFDGDFQK